MISANPLALSRPSKAAGVPLSRASKSRHTALSNAKSENVRTTLRDIYDTASIRPKSSYQQLVNDIYLVYSAIKSAYGRRSLSKSGNVGGKKQTTRKDRNLEICREQLNYQIKQSLRLQRECNIFRLKCKELQNYVSKSGRTISSSMQHIDGKERLSSGANAAVQALKDENRLLKQHIQESTAGDKELELNSQLLDTENQALRKQLQISYKLSQEVFYHYQRLVQANEQDGSVLAMRDEIEQLHRYVEELKTRNALEAAMNALFRGIDPDKAKGFELELNLVRKENLQLCNDLKESSTTIDVLTNEIEKYKTEFKGLKSYNQQLQDSIRQSRDEVLQSSSIIMQQRYIMGKTKNYIVALYAAVQQRDAQISATSAQLAQLVNMLADMQKMPGIFDELAASTLLLCYKLDNIEYAVSLLTEEQALYVYLREMVESRLEELAFHEQRAEMSFYSYERYNEQLGRWLEETQQDLEKANEHILELHNQREHDYQTASDAAVQQGSEKYVYFLKSQIAHILIERLQTEASRRENSHDGL